MSIQIDSRMQSLDYIKSTVTKLQEKSPISEYKFGLALQTISNLKSYFEVDTDAYKGGTEESVLNEIAKRSKGGGIEPGFITGINSQQKNLP